MPALRVIPCLDVAGRVVVKGRKFRNLRIVGDAVQLARSYYLQGADELVFLDVTATVEKRELIFDLLREVAQEVFVPLTVGGGIRTLSQVEKALKSGADKVSIGSFGIRNPVFLKQVAAEFGSQCLVISLDIRRNAAGLRVYLEGGRINSGRNCLEWVTEVQELGAGELLVNSIDRDGSQQGYDVELLEAVAERSSVPLIASGGAGNTKQIAGLLARVPVEGVLLASLLHQNRKGIAAIKSELREEGVMIRC